MKKWTDWKVVYPTWKVVGLNLTSVIVIDYCSQLWMPVKPTEILKVEKLQKDFLNRIPALRGNNYWQKLQILMMISLQRRQERYRIIYIWKILEGLAPNCGIELSGSDDTRQGRKCKVQSIKKGADASAKTLREQTFQVHGPQLFNILPPYLRNLTKCPAEIFKEKLDQYLMKVPDEPSVPGLVPTATTPEARPSNSLLHQRPRQQAQEERRRRTRPGTWRGARAKTVATKWQLMHVSKNCSINK